MAITTTKDKGFKDNSLLQPTSETPDPILTLTEEGAPVLPDVTHLANITSSPVPDNLIPVDEDTEDTPVSDVVDVPSVDDPTNPGKPKRKKNTFTPTE